MNIKPLILCEEITAVLNVTVYKTQIRHVSKMMDIKGLIIIIIIIIKSIVPSRSIGCL